MSNETSKAMKRRKGETLIPWNKIFQGNGIDVGCGPDKLPFEDCIGFDLGDGDANKLDEYFPENHFDYLHASHVLEHMYDATDALLRWLKVVKPGGHIVGEVPSWELYEGKRSRSIYNPDHKSTWSMWNKIGAGELPHHFAPNFFSTMTGSFYPIQVRLVDANYDYIVGSSIDQTNTPGNEVECFIEFVIKKI